MNPILDQPLLLDKSVDETASVGVDTSKYVELTHHVSWKVGVTAGEVQIETADDPLYAGTWAVVATVTFVGTAPLQQYARTQGAYKAMRHRINTAVAGGVVSTKITGAA